MRYSVYTRAYTLMTLSFVLEIFSCNDERISRSSHPPPLSLPLFIPLINNELVNDISAGVESICMLTHERCVIMVSVNSEHAGLSRHIGMRDAQWRIVATGRLYAETTRFTLCPAMLRTEKRCKILNGYCETWPTALGLRHKFREAHALARA